MPKEISVTEAAKKLGVHPTRIRLLCAEGRIVGARLVVGRWVIPTPVSIIAAETPGGTPKLRMKKPKRTA